MHNVCILIDFMWEEGNSLTSNLLTLIIALITQKNTSDSMYMYYRYI